MGIKKRRSVTVNIRLSCQNSKKTVGGTCQGKKAVEGQEGSSGPEGKHARTLKRMSVTAEMCCSGGHKAVMSVCATGREMCFDCTSSQRLTEASALLHLSAHNKLFNACQCKLK